MKHLKFAISLENSKQMYGDHFLLGFLTFKLTSTWAIFKLALRPTSNLSSQFYTLIIGKQPPDKIDTNMRKCSNCKNLQKDPVYLSECGHYFCKSCTKLFFEKTMICPTCKQERNQPVGYMSWRTEKNNSLPGYEKCGTIAITYNFDGGIQGLGESFLLT